MKRSEAPSPAPSYTGHVKDGVMVLDTQVSLPDGQAVRVEPIPSSPASLVPSPQAERVRELQRLFAEWTAEDANLTDDEADQLQAALEQSGRLRFRSAELD